MAVSLPSSAARLFTRPPLPKIRDDQQIQALENSGATPPRLVNPRTGERFVLLRAEEYERLKEDEYDDSPWTREELQALAWEAGKHAGWEDMDEYDDLPERPRHPA
jgi:PHD/YefM family antitoxin component YafN of YafNO toxin-antitoxin module